MSTNFYVIAWVLGLSAATPVQKPAQESPPKPVPAEHTQKPAQAAAGTMIPVGSLRGADLVFEGAPPGKSDPAAGREPASAPKAKIADLIMSTRDGRLSYAVVSISGGQDKDKTVVVPAADLKFALMDDKPSASVRMTPVQIQGQPAFDIEKAKKEGVESALTGGKSAPSDPGTDKPKGDKADKKGEKAEGGNPHGDAIPKFALSSQLGAWGVHASDKPFGMVKDGALDTEKSTISYLFVAPTGGGDTIVVPFAACNCARTDKDVILKVGKTTEQLGSVPKYEKPAQGLLSVDQMKRAEEFFGTRGAVGSQG